MTFLPVRGSTRRTLNRTYEDRVSLHIFFPVPSANALVRGPLVAAFSDTHSLAQWPTLADGDLVANLNTECRRDVGGKVLVAPLVTVVLGDEVEVLAADDEGTVHLGADDLAGEDTATDADETGEWALLVCASPALADILILPSSNGVSSMPSPHPPCSTP